MAKLKTVDVDGRKVAVEVDDRGVFMASCDGDEWSDHTLDGVITKVRRDLRKQKVRIAIPATALGVELYKPEYGRAHSRSAIGKVRHLVITGMHGRSGNVLVKWEDNGETEQLSGWAWRSEGEIMRRLTDTEVTEYAQLAKEKQRADKAIEAFVEKRKLGTRKDIREYVEDAIKQKVDDPKEDAANDALEGDPRIAVADTRSRTRRRS